MSDETVHQHAIVRPITVHRIVNRVDRVWPLVAPANFALAYEGVVQPDTVLGQPLIYCADLAAERALYTVQSRESLEATFAEPTLYAAQLKQARRILSVPFERLEEMAPMHGLHPTFIFSLGRTGSTLLSRMLDAIGRSSVSEPDLFTQIAVLGPGGQRRLGSVAERQLLLAGVASLARYRGRDVFIKLRNQCNAAPERLMAAVPYAKAAFMLRDRHAWGLSRHRAFGETPRKVANTLREAVVALDRLLKIGVTPTVVWYEDLLARPHEVLLKLVAHSALAPKAIGERVAGVLSVDSQEGSAVARDKLEAKQVDAGFADEFDREWRAIVPTPLIKQHDLGPLA